MHGAERQRVAADLLHQRRHRRAEMFEQRLQLLTPDEFGCVGARDLGEVRAEHRDRIEDERAGVDGASAHVGRNPGGRQPVDRLALDLHVRSARDRFVGDGEQPLELAAGPSPPSDRARECRTCEDRARDRRAGARREERRRCRPRARGEPRRSDRATRRQAAARSSARDRRRSRCATASTPTSPSASSGRRIALRLSRSRASTASLSPRRRLRAERSAAIANALAPRARKSGRGSAGHEREHQQQAAGAAQDVGTRKELRSRDRRRARRPTLPASPSFPSPSR